MTRKSTRNLMTTGLAGAQSDAGSNSDLSKIAELRKLGVNVIKKMAASIKSNTTGISTINTNHSSRKSVIGRLADHLGIKSSMKSSTTGNSNVSSHTKEPLPSVPDDNDSHLKATRQTIKSVSFMDQNKHLIMENLSLTPDDNTSHFKATRKTFKSVSFMDQNKHPIMENLSLTPDDNDSHFKATRKTFKSVSFKDQNMH